MVYGHRKWVCISAGVAFRAGLFVIMHVVYSTVSNLFERPIRCVDDFVKFGLDGTNLVQNAYTKREASLRCEYDLICFTVTIILIHEMEGTVFALAFEGMKHFKSEEGEMLSIPFLDVCKQILPVIGNETKLGMSRGIVEPKLTAIDAMIDNSKQKDSNSLIFAKYSNQLSYILAPSQPVKQWLLDFVCLLSTVLAFAYCLSRLVDKSHATSHSTTVQGDLSTTAALSVVTQFTRQLLIEQAGECLTHLTRQLEDQDNVTDPVARLRMQSSALRSGALLQNLGSLLASTVNPREASGREQSTTTDPAAASDGGVSNREAVIRNLSQPRGGPDVPVVPIRISTMPLRLASSEQIYSSVSVVYPVLARAQHANSSNVSGSHARSTENRPPEAPEIHEIPSGLDQLLRNLFPAVNSQEASTHISGGADGSSSVEENQDRGASSSRPYGPSSPPSPKRRKLKLVISSSDLSWDPAPKEQANTNWLLLILAFMPDFYDICIGDGLKYMTANPIAWNGSVNPRKINAINKHNRACNEVPPTVGTKSVARRIHMRDLQNGEASSSCTPAEICIEKLGHIPGDIRGWPGSTKHVFETEILWMDLNSEKEKSKQLEKDHLELKENHLKKVGSEDYDTEDYDDYVEAQDDV
uniref:Uncharacterized protein n=1 Tax=Tanacetum cinerariifolium TaxID=118510 RepID=A0A6L2LFG1_TANCI|nr:hypothetical protein [Tanacetum cinerariifolium]